MVPHSVCLTTPIQWVETMEIFKVTNAMKKESACFSFSDGVIVKQYLGRSRELLCKWPSQQQQQLYWNFCCYFEVVKFAFALSFKNATNSCINSCFNIWNMCYLRHPWCEAPKTASASASPLQESARPPSCTSWTSSRHIADELSHLRTYCYQFRAPELTG